MKIIHDKTEFPDFVKMLVAFVDQDREKAQFLEDIYSAIGYSMPIMMDEP